MRKAFDPNDPFDVVAEHFRKEICELTSRMLDDPAYRALTPVQQLEAFMGGALTGIIGCCFAHVEAGGRNHLWAAMLLNLPQAREQAEAIMDSAKLQS